MTDYPAHSVSAFHPLLLMDALKYKMALKYFTIKLYNW